MKGTKSALLITALLVLVGCGGGGSTDGAGGGTDGGGAGGGGTGSEAPAEVAGSYDAVWQGGGVVDDETITCSGTFEMQILQTGGVLAVTAKDNTREGDCGDEFVFTARGSYDPTTGAIDISSPQGSTTLSISGNATEEDGKIKMSGQWSVIETASAVVVASGVWSAESQ